MLGLPREIRDHIYDIVLREELPIEIIDNGGFIQRLLPVPSPLGLLLCCKSIGEEAAYALYRNEFTFAEGAWLDLLRVLLEIGGNVTHLKSLSLNCLNVPFPVNDKAGLYMVPCMEHRLGQCSHVKTVEQWDPILLDYLQPFTRSGIRAMYHVDGNARSIFRLLNGTRVRLSVNTTNLPRTDTAKFYEALRSELAPTVELYWTGSTPEERFSPVWEELGQEGWEFAKATRSLVGSRDNQTAKITFTARLTNEKHSQPGLIRDEAVQRLVLTAAAAVWDGESISYKRMSQLIPAVHEELFEEFNNLSVEIDTDLPVPTLPNKEMPSKTTPGWWAGFKSMGEAWKDVAPLFMAAMFQSNVPNDENIETYLRNMQAATVKFFAYFQLLSLSPTRSTDIVRARWCNGPNTPRSLFFSHTGILITIDGVTQTLPLNLTALFVPYIVYVLPLTDLLLKRLGRETDETLTPDVRSHIWRFGSTIWTPAQARTNFSHGAQELLGVSLPLKAWQEIISYRTSKAKSIPVEVPPMKWEDDYD